MASKQNPYTESKSLVKYSKPVVVPKNHSSKAKKNILNLDDDSTANTQDILNSILPPLQVEKAGQMYMECVLSTPATKSDVIHLQKELDNRLQTMQARETGICPIREELYSQSFDELIRQITINCSHRGLLLVRVRDEMRMTLQSYQVYLLWHFTIQTLYESALAFGMRFALKGEKSKTDKANL